MDKYQVKKILFYISISPYVYAIAMSIYSAIFGYGYNMGDTAYGLVGIGNFLSDFGVQILLGIMYLSVYPITRPIILGLVVLFIGYPIYCFVSSKNDKQKRNENIISYKEDKLKESKNVISYREEKREDNKKVISNNEETIGENKNNVKKITLAEVFFVVSILCWIAWFLSGVYAGFSGFDTGGFLETKMIYGAEAMRKALVWNLIGFSVIPILPVSLIYIIIYLCGRKK